MFRSEPTKEDNSNLIYRLSNLRAKLNLAQKLFGASSKKSLLKRLGGLGSKVAVTVLVLLCFVGTGITAKDGVMVYSGVYDGNFYLQQDEPSKLQYITGVYDGIQLAPLFGAPEDNMGWVYKCCVGMTNLQLKAIVERFMKDNPQRWHDQMNILVYSALIDACKKYRK